MSEDRHRYAMDLGRAWMKFCSDRDIGLMIHDKDEKVGKAFMAGYILGIAGKGVIDEQD